MATNYGKLDFAVAFNRQTAYPLDGNSYFESKTAADTAIKNAKEAGSDKSQYYYGQLITVYESGTANVYQIQKKSSTEAVLAKIGGEVTITDTTSDTTHPFVSDVTASGSTLTLSRKSISTDDMLSVDNSGAATVKISHAESGVTASTTQQIAKIAYNKYGHVTGATKATVSDILGLGDYYWANVKVSSTSSDTTTPTFDGITLKSKGITLSQAQNITWVGGSYHQRIFMTDDDTVDTAVFTFQQSTNSGSSWNSLFTVKDNGSVVASKFITSGSSNQYVVLGDGTTKALSDFGIGSSGTVGDYLPLTGSSTNSTTNNMTGPITFWHPSDLATGKTYENILINSYNKDVNIWHVYGNSGSWASQYGFNLLYKGEGSGNDNYLALYAHNQSNATHPEVYRILQDGTTTWKTAINFTGGISEGGTTLSNKYQAKDADLTAIAGLTGTSGFLKKTAADTWTLDTTVVTGSGLTANALVRGNGSSTIKTSVATLDDSGNMAAKSYKIDSKATWQYNSSTDCVELVW